MTNVSKSPERHSFQLEMAKERAEADGKEVPEFYENFWKSAKEQDEANLLDPEWQKDNLEYDLRSSDWMCDKVRKSDAYAQNLYAAMCNMQFIKLELWPVLKDQRWSCSWRHSGGIVADMRQQGDYIDWYCSGIRNGDDPDCGYVPEGTVTEEIQMDLKALGWVPVEWDDEE